MQAAATAKKSQGGAMDLLKTYNLSEMTYAQTRKLMERPRVDFTSILDTARDRTPALAPAARSAPAPSGPKFHAAASPR